jgi:hypothetical protein
MCKITQGISEKYGDLAKEMERGRYSRDWEQCKLRIENLKTEYRAPNVKTGRGRKAFHFLNKG